MNVKPESIYHFQAAEIEELLVGHTVTKVADDTLTLDDGRQLRFVGNKGGCSCVSGDYDLTELNGVDNIITRVELVNNPDRFGQSDDERGPGVYQVFVFADNRRINLASFEGSDGSGYYGTGYEILVLPPAGKP